MSHQRSYAVGIPPAARVADATATLTVDLGRLVANYRGLKARAVRSSIGAVVKANAYGLGAAVVGKALLQAGCNDFFVAVLEEAISLRHDLGPGPRIFVLGGLQDGRVSTYERLSLIPVLNSLEQCQIWAATGGLPAVLQVDTGMSRLGLSVAEQHDLAASGYLADLNLVMIMSHLANADVPGHNGNEAQLQAFRAACQAFPGLPASLANSAGIFLSENYHFDLCRPGAGLYGIDIGPRSEGLLPVVALHARISQVRTVPAGTGIGYGHSFIADRTMKLITIGVGYADGWPRSLSPGAAVWLGDQRLPLVGRVSMDSFVADATEVDNDRLSVGTEVELIGPHQSVDDVARVAGTIGYEILTGMGERLHRHYQ